jgi:multidrug efflux system membrane fusion protein
MVVVNQIQPIYVTFSVPEQYLSEINKYMSDGKVKVQAFVTKGEDNPEEGILTFVDNTVDVATGTIKLKATFANKRKRLWPGQFVDVVMILTTQPNAIVVPTPADQAGQNGQYVFIIKNDLTVEARSIVAGRTLNSETVVEKGVQPGERVVTDGHLRLVPGATVEIKNKAGYK